jgi:SagB-type dehydrogenase family enzyme
MKRLRVSLLALLLAISCVVGGAADETPMTLPAPSVSGAISLEQALAERRSIRRFQPGPMALEHLSQLLWAAQGVTDPRGFRTTPSAGGLYPLRVYAAVGSVAALGPGLYRYRPEQHVLARLGDRDIRASLVDAAFGQAWIDAAPAILVITAREATTRRKYGDRAPTFVAIEVGHAAQNIYLQAHALGLGTTAVGGFDAERARRLLGLPDNETVLLMMPVGTPAD